MSRRIGKVLVVLAIPAGIAVGLAVFDALESRRARAQDEAKKDAAAQLDRPLRVGDFEFKSQREFVASGRRCDTPIPTENQIRRARLAAESVRRIAGVENSLSPRTEVIIRVRFNVIHMGDQGKLKAGQIAQQINVLNKAYKPAGFRFQAADIRYEDVQGTDHEGWFTMAHISEDETNAKKKLVKDPSSGQVTSEAALNVYTANIGDGLLGWATFPSDLAGGKELDGVVLLHSTFPAEDGTANPAGGPYGRGQSGTHEIGHWLGLYHTFQGGCVPPGDEVDDTPPHQSNGGCPAPVPDTCSGDKDPNDPTKPWLDPVHNYMNYTDDVCMNDVTAGQIRRMREQTTTFRPKLYDVPDEVQEQIFRAARAAATGR